MAGNVRLLLVAVALSMSGAACTCGSRRDQVVVAATIEQFESLDLVCNAGCGAVLYSQLQWSEGGAPVDEEQVQVSFAPSGSGTETLTFIRDYHPDEIGGKRGYDMGVFTIVITDNESTVVSFPPTSAPIEVYRNPDPQPTGELCGIEEYGELAIVLDATQATSTPWIVDTDDSGP